MVEWTLNSGISGMSATTIIGLTIISFGIFLSFWISYYFLRDWKKSLFVFLGYLFTTFSIQNEPFEKFNILFPIFTLIVNGIGFIIIFSQFIPLKKIKKLRLFK